jgi:hypothetical protein
MSEWGLTVSSGVMGRPARATSARSRPPDFQDDPAQSVRYRSCHNLAKQGARRPWLVTAQSGTGLVDASARTGYPRRSRLRSGRGRSRTAGRRSPVVARAGHEAETRVKVAPVLAYGPHPLLRRTVKTSSTAIYVQRFGGRRWTGVACARGCRDDTRLRKTNVPAG